MRLIIVLNKFFCGARGEKRETTDDPSNINNFWYKINLFKLKVAVKQDITNQLFLFGGVKNDFYVYRTYF